MGFTKHFYIIFGTNLLTKGLVQIVVFLPISVFRRKGYQTESKQNETFGRVIFGTNVIQETWSGRQGSNDEEVDSPPCTERRTKQTQDPAAGQSKAAMSSVRNQKRRYVANVSIIFIVPCYYIIIIGCFNIIYSNFISFSGLTY